MKTLLTRVNVAILISVLAILVALAGVFFNEEDPVRTAYLCSMAEASVSNAERFKGENHTAAVVGYTGEMGEYMIKHLNELKLFKRVVLIGRREIPLSLGPEFEQKVVDFDKLDEHKDVFQGPDVLFYCLGTTLSASGTEQFIKIDRDYLLKIAEIGKEQSLKHFSLLSSAYAKASSSSLYLKIKGETEEGVKALGFDRVSIFRPSALLGKKKENLSSRVMKGALKPVFALFPTALSVHRETVAVAMITDAISPATEESKVQVFENKDIHKIAKGCPK